MKAALRCLSKERQSGVLSLDELVPGRDGTLTVLDELKRKHPPADELHPEALLQGCSSPSHSVIFDKIDGSLIRCAVLQCQGSAGP